MPVLDWIGKQAVVDHHTQVPYRLLRCDERMCVGEPGSGNLLVEGDNLEALKALLPYYARRVKCIYIDPPYNTGDESWVYNDAVNSPAMRSWLGKVVGREGEDLSRHDKWLCMMYPRLALLREFLRDDGIIFVSIDENEVGYLRLLMDELFGRKNALGTLVWKRRSSSAMRGMPLSIDHEYCLVYALTADRGTLYGLEKGIGGYPHEDERGRYASTDLTVGMGRDARPGQYYAITNPRSGVVYEPNPERVWRFFPETMQEVIAADLIIWPDEASERMARPRYKTYYDPDSAKPKPVSTWIETHRTNESAVTQEEAEYDVSILRSGMTQEGGRLLQRILGRKAFAYPKPLSLIRAIVRAATRGGDLIMDSFAGTGTTGHAVLSLNKEDGGERRVILVEMEAEVAREVAAERLKRVIEGYTYAKPKGETVSVDGLGAGFRYCRLGSSLFDAAGRISPQVRFEDLARHVYFIETGEALAEAVPACSPLVGKCRGIGYYLLFNGVLGDGSRTGGNVLTGSVLARIPKQQGLRVVYGEGCTLGPARLERENVVFKQIPYEVVVA